MKSERTTHKKIIVISIIVLSLIISFFIIQYKTPDVFIDTSDVATEHIIDANKVPLSSKPKVKTVVKKKVKVQKMKKPAKKTTKKVTSKTKKYATKSISYNKQTKKNTTVKTTVKTQTKKKSKKKTITTTTKTTVVTTVTTLTSYTGNINTSVPKASSRLRSMFKSKGYKIKYDSKVSYAGKFDPGMKEIVLKRDSTVAYHEFGHFVAFMGGRADVSGEFKDIYNSEKSKYNYSNKAYATQSSSEYFAESYKNYVLEGSKLKKERPQTYSYMSKVLGRI